jgi:hypothetical protein
MATSPIFTDTPRQEVQAISTANTARDGSGTIATVFTAGSSGSRVERTRVTATGTVTDGVVRLFLHDGSNARLLKEVMVSATTPSTTVETYTATVTWTGGLMLPNGWSIRASTHNAEGFNVFVEGGDF